MTSEQPAFRIDAESPGWAKSVELAIRRQLRPLRDRLANLRHVRGPNRILVARHPAGLPSYYAKFLEWIGREFPEQRRLFELHLLPCRVQDWSRYQLVLPWLPDTLLYRSAAARAAAEDLVAQADRHGVPVVNRPERLLGTSKHDCARRLSELGVRTPFTTRIDNAAAFRRDMGGRKLPLLIREDLAHGGWSPVFLIERAEQLSDVPLERFERPIAVEFIDVRSPQDGLVRKYRYMAMKETGLAHSLQISRKWEVRSGVRLLNSTTVQEELAYTAGDDPNHEQLQRVREALGLDFLGFDYSYDLAGELVVWEINILPGLGLPEAANREHLVPVLTRTMALTLRMYLQFAGYPVPRELDRCARSTRRGVTKAA